LSSRVSKGGTPDYDVLHAAAFAGGIGGTAEICKLLLDRKAAITQNLAKEFPLHKAFQTGKVELIPLFQEAMKSQNLLTKCDDYDSVGVDPPLKVGIKMGKLSEKDLVDNATLTPDSLKIFLNNEPSCVGAFLERWKNEDDNLAPEDKATAETLAPHVTIADICEVFRKDPMAGASLLEALTDVPVCENPGWHPLPLRVSFAPRNMVERIQNMMNPPRWAYPLYQSTKEWEFDSISFKNPPWHETYVKRDWDYPGPVKDVVIKVVHVPDLLCGEFFSALSAATTGDTMEIFEQPIVRGSLNAVWYFGAVKVEMCMFCLTAWSLVLVVSESWWRSQSRGDAHVGLARRLHPTGAGTMGTANTDHMSVDVAQADIITDLSISCNFIAARAVIDLVLEFFQLCGSIRIKRGWDYLHPENHRDIVRCALPIVFLFHAHSRVVFVLVILVLWFRLKEMYFAEHIMVEILPITQVAAVLVPSTVVFSIGFAAFMHVFWVLENVAIWPQTFFDTFSILITAALPDGAEDKSVIYLVANYIAVMAFSVFFLNIFIGVIGEAYTAEKEKSSLTYQNERSSLCLTFILRAMYMPCWIMSRFKAQVLGALAIISAVSLQGYAIVKGPTGYETLLFIFLIGMFVFTSFQTPNCRFVGGHGEKHYLWVAWPADEPDPSQADIVEQKVAKLEPIENNLATMKAAIDQYNKSRRR
jgi:hypothetical protein